jgi:hypothetical protein
MSLLSRDAILNAQDLARENVSVPEWGGEVLVQGLSGAQRDAYEATIISLRGTNAQMNLINARAKLVARCLVDEQGQRLFGDDDIKALAGKSAIALQRVYDVAARLSGLSNTDLEELAKTSGNGLPDASPSD